MLEITPLTTRSCDAALSRRVGTQHLPVRPEPGAERVQDQVELSPAAEQFETEPQQTAAMQDRIRVLRARIADGTYLTPDKIDVVVQRLHAEIFGRGASET